MTKICTCPEMPEIEPGAPTSDDEVRCTCCNQPLRLACAGCGRDGAVGVVPNPKPASKPEVKRESRPRTYKPKPCVECGNDFMPTGPRSARCDGCAHTGVAS